MKISYFFVFLIFIVWSTSACAWHLESDPSPQNAEMWKIELESGEVYTGDTVNGALWWTIDGLAPGTYTGKAYFGNHEWVLESEGTVQKEGAVWSKNGTDFTLHRNADPDDPSTIKIKENKETSQ